MKSFNVIDTKNNLSLSDFNLYSNNYLKHICKINPNADIKFNKVEKLEYITIENFLENPEELKNFLKNFPTEDRMKSIEESQFTDIVSQAPGFQQTYNSIFFKPLSQYFHKILNDKGLVHFNWNNNLWDFYTNCMYSGMKSYNRNYLPHIDEFSYAANIYLSDIENTSTSFFKFVGLENEYYHLSEMINNFKEKEYYRNLIYQKNSNEMGIQNWKVFEGNENYKLYHTIPAKYNCVSFYKGKYWHSVKFDASIPNNIRYSLVAVLQ